MPPEVPTPVVSADASSRCNDGLSCLIVQLVSDNIACSCPVKNELTRTWKVNKRDDEQCVREATASGACTVQEDTEMVFGKDNHRQTDTFSW